jgi:DNA-directed RNA polymerase specialized sigma24 family protein
MGSLSVWAADATLEELVAAAKDEGGNDSVAMNEIVRRFEPKALKLASFLSKDYHLQQYIANAARYGVVMAVRAHTSGTPGVAAYIATTMRGEAYRAIDRNTESHETVKPIESPVWTTTRNVVEDTTIVDTDLGLITQDLSVEQRSLVLKRYIIGESVSNIANDAGTSVSAVSQRFKTVHTIVEMTAARYEIAVA